MDEAQKFFFAECAARARELPLSDAVKFLRGWSVSCEDSPEQESVRRILVALSESDRQLELIKTGQMKLQLGSSEGDQ